MTISISKFRRSAFSYSLLILSVWGASSCSGCKEKSDPLSRKNPLHSSQDIKKALTIQKAIREIYQEVNPSVVRIETEQEVEPSRHPFSLDPFFRRFFDNAPQGPQKREGLGSGFIFSQTGHIVTNYHVIKNVDKIRIKLVDGRMYEARVEGYDENSDLALLHIEGDQKGKELNLKPVQIGNSKELSVGDTIFAIGNPFGLSSTLTMGVVSSIAQELHTADGVPRIQVDAAINPGNSGGPLLDIYGRVVGINQMIYTSNQNQGFIGIAFSIPIDFAVSVIEKLMSGEKIERPYIGVQIFASIPLGQLERLGINNANKGLLVQNVIDDSPAWRSGVRPLDYITHLDENRIEEFDQFRSLIAKKGIGKTITIQFIRRGLSKRISIRIGKYPDDD